MQTVFFTSGVGSHDHEGSIEISVNIVIGVFMLGGLCLHKPQFLGGFSLKTSIILYRSFRRGSFHGF